MKKISIICLIFCGIIFFKGVVLALTIGPTNIDVGELDQIVNSGTVGNSAAEELAWVQGYLGTDFVITDTYNVSSAEWTVTNQNSNQFALDLLNTPGYFFIKLGIGRTSLPYTHILYQNLEELNYAVVDITSWGATASNIDIGRISHLGEIQGTSVPEPSSLLLLGIGLIGFVTAKRFRK